MSPSNAARQLRYRERKRGHSNDGAVAGQGKVAPYRKMKVTGPRSAELVVPITPINAVQAMREYNPTVNAMVQANDEMSAALANAEAYRRDKRKKRATPSSSLAIYDLGLQRLRALKSQFEQAYDPLVQLLTQRAPPPMIPPLAPDTMAGPSTSTSSDATLTRVLEVLPEQYRNKYTLLHGYMKAQPGAIRVTETGRPVIDGVEIPTASFTDAMRSLYVWRKAEDLPRSTREIIKSLQAIGVPSTLLSSTAAKNAYHDLLAGESEGEEAYESPSDEPIVSTKPLAAPSTSGRIAPIRVALQKQLMPPTMTVQGQGGRGAPRIVWPGKRPKVIRLYSVPRPPKTKHHKYAPGKEPEVLFRYKV